MENPPRGIVNTDIPCMHRPLFTELQELSNDGGDFIWRESARWVKFEEDVEEGGNRWSKPHVASLSFNSITQLKRLIGDGRALFDVEAESIERLAEIVVEEAELQSEISSKVKKLLLKRRKHQFQMIKAKENNVSLMCYKPGVDHKSGGKVRKKDVLLKGETKIEIIKSQVSISSDTSKGEIKLNHDFLRKIPKKAEASNILVGEVDFLDKTLCIFIRLNTGKILEDMTEVPIPSKFFFILLVPKTVIFNCREIGRAMGTLMSDELFQKVAYEAQNTSQILEGIDDFMNVVTVLPPGEWDPTIRIEPPASIPSQDTRKHLPQIHKFEEEELDEEWEEQKIREETGLARSGVLFGGLINDIKRKVPFYWSDFKDALAMQSIASWIFLYFACLSPIITFGGLLAQATGNNMAAMESLVSGFVCGMIYGLFSGQPLSILGSTGPVLVFETIVYDFCIKTGWDYMSFRFWIGTWVAVILFVLVAIDASAYVCYITRFTEENFAFLIALIFIIKAIENVILIGNQFQVKPTDKMIDYNCSCYTSINDTFALRDSKGFWNEFDKNECRELNGTMIGTGCDTPLYVPDVFFLSVLLCLGTFLISIELKAFKNALFFPAKVRQFISDFAVIIAIVSMTLLDYTYGVATPKLEVPHEFKPTLPTRGWLIPPFNGNPLYSVFVAIPPAFLGTILIFMDQQITSVIINRREHKLKKQCGYHLDLFVLSILIQICSVMGLPWFVAATVLSITHVNSLKLESECSAPGEKPQFLGVREQRVTHVLIFLTIGLSVFLTPVLSHVPMPVLYGVFLYMGISSLGGMQFYERLLILFMPNKYQPDYVYLRKVPIRRVHLFTLIQLVCFACLWIVKSFSATSILFPIMLVVMVAVRKVLDRVFTQRELKVLDNLIPSNRKVKKRKGLTGFILGPKLIKGDLKGDGAECALKS